MTYEQTLDYLYQRLPMYQRVGASAFKKDLSNTQALCEFLGRPERRFQSVHIGGTNGKGSVSHLLAAAFQQAGLRVGLYVSPHYKDFRERIRINGRYISRAAVVDFVQRCMPVIEKIQPSFFELTVAMAFDHFARRRVDVAVVEVGLGGRLDSTNVITPALSVITNISFDHMDMLGNTLPLIAGEKAGIIKPGVPVVVGERGGETDPVFEQKAAAYGSPIAFAQDEYAIEPVAISDWKRSFFAVKKKATGATQTIEVEAAGPYLAQNLCTAFAAWDRCCNASAWRPHALSPDLLPLALPRLRALTLFRGRWEVVSEAPLALADSAHNEAGLRLLFGAVQSYREAHKPKGLRVVCGFVNDKDISKALQAAPADAHYYFAKANIPRGLDANLLRDKAREFGLVGTAFPSVRKAYRAALRDAVAADDLVLVCGSIFVAAEVM